MNSLIPNNSDEDIWENLNQKHMKNLLKNLMRTENFQQNQNIKLGNPIRNNLKKNIMWNYLCMLVELIEEEIIHGLNSTRKKNPENSVKLHMQIIKKMLNK